MATLNNFEIIFVAVVVVVVVAVYSAVVDVDVVVVVAFEKLVGIHQKQTVHSHVYFHMQQVMPLVIVDPLETLVKYEMMM